MKTTITPTRHGYMATGSYRGLQLSAIAPTSKRARAIVWRLLILSADGKDIFKKSI